MALSLRKPWVAVAVGLSARLLMAGALVCSVLLKYANHVGFGGGYELQSYTYAVVTAGAAAVGAVPQFFLAVHHLFCLARRGREPCAAALDASMYADVAATVALASGVGAGFGATNDVRRMADGLVRWEGGGGGTKAELEAYYDRGTVAVVLLLVGMLLSVCASVVSARLRVRASEGHLVT
jgi:hypothetical protein